ncbi:hypothetical protein T265_07317 [Opisthorchis viverrini]|uniref:Fibronectin type-III domain-containing protein n=1 Tax=Opisthorchis viverrini TaxID=6198 RepID=A0A074ZHM0_OPIVI|nr:hypothetical protein T265_07317 [Opisthorchis viverrini]KER25217.1 hypothetical protein T265_07317 [Opisthorchis viverrini]
MFCLNPNWTVFENCTHLQNNLVFTRETQLNLSRSAQYPDFRQPNVLLETKLHEISECTLTCKLIWFFERLIWNPAECLVCDVLRQLNVLHQAASCFGRYDIRRIAIHVAENPSTAHDRFRPIWGSSGMRSPLRTSQTRDSAGFHNLLSCKLIWFFERLIWNPAECLVCDVLRQLNVLHQAASCFGRYDIRRIAIHVAENPSTAHDRFRPIWGSSGMRSPLRTSQTRDSAGFHVSLSKKQISLQMIPLKPTNISLNVLRDEKKIHVTWNDSEICPATKFTVLLSAGKQNSNVISAKPEIYLDWVTPCTSHYIYVSSENIHGGSGRSEGVKLSLPRVPLKPTNISLNVLRDEKKIHVTWNDSEICPATKFTVLLSAGKQNSNVISAKPEIYLDWVTPCTSHYIYVSSENIHGGSGRSEGVKLSLPRDFDPPRNIRISPNHTESRITVTWEKNRECSSTQYEISIYDTNSEVVNRTLFGNSPGEITQLPKRASMFLTIRTRGLWWVGDESDKQEFHLHDRE